MQRREALALEALRQHQQEVSIAFYCCELKHYFHQLSENQ
jgi:hypothetical protein